ncbi:MAG: DeoR family transcriptional regulator [bacterium]|nr:DeoR family transcriptional regulator [bacterium]MDZ4296679.1 DeoR family transcriptional regulator [Patescibacteria group bacterium]
MREAVLPGEQLSLAVYRLTKLFPKDEPLRAKIRMLALDIALAAKRAGDGTAGDAPVQRLEEYVDGMLLLLDIAKVQGFAEERNFTVLAEHYAELKKGAIESSALMLLRENQERQKHPVDEEAQSGSSARRAEASLPSSAGGRAPGKESLPSFEIHRSLSQSSPHEPSASLAEKASALPEKSFAPAGKTQIGEILNKRQKKIVQHFRTRHAFQLREVRSLFEGYSQKTLRNDLKELCRKGILNREGVGTVSFYRVVENAL